jgi:ankyrin repeat protein
MVNPSHPYSAVVATFYMATIRVCLHDVSLMYLCVESAHRVEADPNARNEDGSTAIHVAFTDSCLEIKALLLKHEADINARGKDGCTLLHATITKGDTEMLEELFHIGADINDKGDHGQTPLHAASIQGLRSVVKKLLENGADVNATDNRGQTPLDAAFTQGHEDIVKRLSEKQAEDKKAEAYIEKKPGRSSRNPGTEKKNAPKRRKT